MKYAFIALALVSTLASAESFEIFKSDKNTVSWVIYPETFYKTNNGYAVMVGRRATTPPNKENRDFMGVEFTTCTRGFGTLYTKKTMQDEWRASANVSVSNSETNADVLAGFICEVGAEVEKIMNSPVDNRKKISV